jgi:hypothetical protein
MDIKLQSPLPPGEGQGERKTMDIKLQCLSCRENLGEGETMDIKRQSLAYRQRTWARGKTWT